MAMTVKSRAVAVVPIISVSTTGLLSRTYRKHLEHQPFVSNRDELRRADELAWNNRWVSAAAVYRDIEKRSIEEKNEPAALYAHVSQYIVRAESESVQPLLSEIQPDLQRPDAASPELRLRLLVIEGMLATNFDAALARKVWKEVETQTKYEHEYRLMMRAPGEGGIAGFYLGDVRSSKREVTRAWIAARPLHDPAAQARYASVYGAGLVELQRDEEANRVPDSAIKTANANPEVAIPASLTTQRSLFAARRHGGRYGGQ